MSDIVDFFELIIPAKTTIQSYIEYCPIEKRIKSYGMVTLINSISVKIQTSCNIIVSLSTNRVTNNFIPVGKWRNNLLEFGIYRNDQIIIPIPKNTTITINDNIKYIVKNDASATLSENCCVTIPAGTQIQHFCTGQKSTKLLIGENCLGILTLIKPREFNQKNNPYAMALQQTINSGTQNNGSVVINKSNIDLLMTHYSQQTQKKTTDNHDETNNQNVDKDNINEKSPDLHSSKTQKRTIDNVQEKSSDDHPSMDNKDATDKSNKKICHALPIENVNVISSVDKTH